MINVLYLFWSRYRLLTVLPNISVKIFFDKLADRSTTMVPSALICALFSHNIPDYNVPAVIQKKTSRNTPPQRPSSLEAFKYLLMLYNKDLRIWADEPVYINEVDYHQTSHYVSLLLGQDADQSVPDLVIVETHPCTGI